MSANRTQAQDYPKPIVFYDGGCPMCSREIAHYRRLDRNASIDWVDITRDLDTLRRHGLEPATAMRRFHVRDTAGDWQIGAWGFAEMWAHLPYYQVLSRLLRFSGTLPLLDRLYDRFADWRQHRRCNERCMTDQERSG